MSYCVQCGVQLAPAEATCPLCGTPVVNPNGSSDAAETQPMFVERMGVPKGKRLNRRFIVNLVFALLLVPFLVTALVGVVFHVDLGWSLYVVAGELCLWVFVFLPLMWRGRKPYWYLVADGLAVLALLVLLAMRLDGWDWVLALAVPILVLCLGVAWGMSWIIRRKTAGALAKTGFCIMALAFVPLGVSIVLAVYLQWPTIPVWGWFTFIPLAVLGILLAILSESAQVGEWVRRNLFV